jgi:hypothetical protein
LHFICILTSGPFAEKLVENWGQTKDLATMSPTSIFNAMIRSLRSCLLDEGHELRADELGVAIVGKDCPFTILGRESIEKLLAQTPTEKFGDQGV